MVSTTATVVMWYVHKIKTRKNAELVSVVSYYAKEWIYPPLAGESLPRRIEGLEPIFERLF